MAVASRLQRWSEAVGKGDAAKFAGRLALSGWTADDAGRAVSPARLRDDAALPEWADMLRLLIARAVVRKPKILFFDEATSALDNRTLAAVRVSLGRLKATRIVIAHRLSTIRHADWIVVLHRGEIVQQGTLEELVSREGLFAEMASLG